MRSLNTSLKLVLTSTLLSTVALAAPAKVAGEQLAPAAVSTPATGPVDFVAGEMLAGETAVIRWAGLAPGSFVSFGVSTAGATGGPCIDSLNLCLDIAQPASIGSAIADKNGTATLKITVPATLRDGVALAFQAIAVDVGTKPFASDVFEMVSGPIDCRAMPIEPVCGDAGRTFGNACSAFENAEPIAHGGACTL